MQFVRILRFILAYFLFSTTVGSSCLTGGHHGQEVFSAERSGKKHSSNRKTKLAATEQGYTGSTEHLDPAGHDEEPQAGCSQQANQGGRTGSQYPEQPRVWRGKGLGCGVCQNRYSNRLQ